jgi:DNA-binding NtrC family response regulator/tetratricopeptide (TPR) repeat protein
MDSREVFVGHIRTGHFREALNAVQGLPSDVRRAPSLALTEAELLVETGELDRGLALATRAYSSTADAESKTMALRIMGQVAFYQGDAEESKNRLRQAKELAESLRRTNRELYASVLLVRWRLFSRVRTLGIGTADFDELRRAVLRSGSPHHLAELRISVAEDEARKFSPHEALRHLEHARRLLDAYPNSWLEGMAYNHTSNVFSILGDTENAMAFAARAVSCTDVSGHFRVRIAAQVNYAELQISRGLLEEAGRSLKLVLAQVGTHVHLKAGALDAAARLYLRQGDTQSARRCFREILDLRRQRPRGMTIQWDLLTELFSRANILQVEGRTERAMHLLKRGIARSVAAGDRVWEVRMRLRLARLAAQNGSSESAMSQLLPVLRRPAEGPETVAEFELARGATENALGNVQGARVHRERGLRISQGLGLVQVATTELLNGGDTTEVQQPSSHGGSIDDAVALIELAGYPHVLGREAYALLELSDATEGQALVACGDKGIRCVATRGWTEAQALEAAAEPGDRLHIVCGVHRDETWAIVAELRATLNDRCTGVAIRKLVDTAVTIDRYRREEKQRAALWPADTLETDGGLWVSEQMTELLSIAKRIAPAEITVLLTGETGTGKEVLARAVHRASGRAAKPFVPFNCTAVPRDMLESQLFGYRKGAFTGAENAFEGIVRAAAGGTLFLDEIAEIGPDLQPKLLRFLETHEVHGLGEAQPVKVDVRVIAATNADLETLVADGHFREDLFYRLNVVRLRLPPLRERREEIPPLIDHYLRKFAEEQKKGRLALDDETLEFLVLYGWPGNVRQLVNEISRVVAYADCDSTITPALLSPEIQASRRTVRVLPGDEPEIRVRLDQPLNDAVEAIERMMVVRALDRPHGNYEHAAKLLGISRKGLFLKRRRWGMQRAS